MRGFHGPATRSVPLVCAACSRVTRLPLPVPAGQRAWDCPSCGAHRALPVALPTLASPEVPPGAVFSETFQRPGRPAAGQPPR